jgi:hypothetical protein
MTLRQGETVTLSVGITRGKLFDQDVALEFGELPTGVTIEPSRPIVRHGEASADVVVRAADAAALGSFRIPMTGHPTEGADTTNSLQLTVVKQ